MYEQAQGHDEIINLSFPKQVPFYGVPTHGNCHIKSWWMQAFYVIQLPHSGTQ